MLDMSAYRMLLVRLIFTVIFIVVTYILLLSKFFFYFLQRMHYIQSVPGGMCETSGECSLC